MLNKKLNIFEFHSPRPFFLRCLLTLIAEEASLLPEISIVKVKKGVVMLDQSRVVIPERFRNHPLFNELHRGMNFGFMAKRGYYAREDVKRQPALMAAAGVNWTTLNANLCQETYASRKVFLDFRFSSGETELTEIMKILHDHGLRILLKPCLTPLDGAWMGSVTFPTTHQIAGVSHDYWTDWFQSFGESAKYFAEFAEQNQVEGLIIGAEYFGTEGQSEHWRQVIADIRGIYSGPLTYEFTHESRKHHPLDWFDELDFLSYNYYPPARGDWTDPEQFRAAPPLTVDDMVAYLEPRRKRIVSISERFGNKPIAFTEIGVRSAHGCVAVPYDFLARTDYDGEEQANYMEAVFRTFSDLPQWLGLYWWKWDETQNRPHYHDDPRGDKGFTIQGKPAEQVLKRWFRGGSGR